MGRDLIDAALDKNICVSVCVSACLQSAGIGLGLLVTLTDE